MISVGPDFRRRSIEALTASALDLLVVGGGIVGAGIARDAAMRGLRVGLVEQLDFAFGTSSRSSRLLHGGLRYLAQGRIGLVREASIEKKILHQIAPHLADPLAFVFPTYRTRPDWKLWQLKTGVKIYDLLCSGKNLGNSTWLNPQQVSAHLPGLNRSDLTGAVRYYDGFTNDARLVLDTLRSAEKNGATVLNYAKFESAEFDSGEWRCDISDVAKASGLPGSTNFGAASTNLRRTVRARAIVNATGPWADKIPCSDVKLRLTKGIHVVVPRARIPVPDAVVMTEGKRILFAIPWGERTILGTTDTDYSGALEDVRANAGDIHCVLQIANEFFPKTKLSERDVISTWAGLRPLIADPNGKPSDISRSHQIKSPKPFWWDVAGGKLTTYRLMAEQAVDQIARKLGGKFAGCRTAIEPLLATGETNGVSGIIPPDFSRAVVEHYCAKEWAKNLDDVMIRRTSWHYYFTNASERAREVADWMAEILGWSSESKEEQIQRYEKFGRTALPEFKPAAKMALSPE